MIGNIINHKTVINLDSPSTIFINHDQSSSAIISNNMISHQPSVSINHAFRNIVDHCITITSHSLIKPWDHHESHSQSLSIMNSITIEWLIIKHDSWQSSIEPSLIIVNHYYPLSHHWLSLTTILTMIQHHLTVISHHLAMIRHSRSINTPSRSPAKPVPNHY